MWACKIREWIGTLLHLRQGWRELWKVVLLRLKLLILLVYVRQACDDLVLDCCFMFSASIFFNSFVKFNLVVCDMCLPVVISWFNIIELFFLIVSIILSAMLIYDFMKISLGFYIFQKTFPSAPWISILNQGKSYILFLDLQLPKLRLSLSEFQSLDQNFI